MFMERSERRRLHALLRALRPNAMNRPTKQTTCLLPGCEKKLGYRWHFCLHHQSLIPRELQDIVAKAWARYQVKEPFNTVANDNRQKQWQLARGVAVVAVQDALGQISVKDKSVV